MPKPAVRVTRENHSSGATVLLTAVELLLAAIEPAIELRVLLTVEGQPPIAVELLL